MLCKKMKKNWSAAFKPSPLQCTVNAAIAIFLDRYSTVKPHFLEILLAVLNEDCECEKFLNYIDEQHDIDCGKDSAKEIDTMPFVIKTTDYSTQKR